MNEKTRTIIDVVMLCLLAAAIIGLFSAVYTVWVNRDMLRDEPLTYVMNRYNMISCICLDQNNEEWFSGDEGWQPHLKKIIKINIQQNFSGINMSEVMG